MTSITIDLPDSLALAAQRSGLFESGRLQRVIEAAVNAQKSNRFMQTARDLQALTTDEPQLSEDEIQAQIQAVRVEMRRAASH
jgi:hypothetical protein